MPCRMRASFFIFFFSATVTAQNVPTHTFDWGFHSAVSGTTLNECDTLSMFAENFAGGDPTDAVAPYTMHVYTPDGIASSPVLGSNPDSLSWTVNYPAGTQLLLSMVDSGGHQGGTPPTYTVGPGSSSSCLQTTPTSSITLTANATTLNTCDPLKVDVVGGTKPYVLSIAVDNQPDEASAQMGANDDQYTWINRAPPNTQVLISVQDATGQFSTATGFIPTQGSSDTTCSGLNSVSGSSGTASSSSATASSTSASAIASKSHTSNIGVIAGAAGGGAALLLVLGILLCLCRQRRRDRTQRSPLDMNTLTGDVPGPSMHNANRSSYATPGHFTPTSQTQSHHPLVRSMHDAYPQSYTSAPWTPGSGSHVSASEHEAASVSGSSSHGGPRMYQAAYPPSRMMETPNQGDANTWPAPSSMQRNEVLPSPWPQDATPPAPQRVASYGAPWMQGNQPPVSLRRNENIPQPWTQNGGGPSGSQMPGFDPGYASSSRSASPANAAARDAAFGALRIAGQPPREPNVLSSNAAQAPSGKQVRLMEWGSRPQSIVVRHVDAGAVPVVDLPPAYGAQKQGLPQ